MSGLAKNSTPVYNEEERVYHLQDGRVITVTLRDAIVPAHPYLALVQAYLLRVRTGEAYAGDRVPRDLRDRLIKTNIQI